MNVYYNSLQRLYDAGKITTAQLDLAITKGWITTKEKQSIIG